MVAPSVIVLFIWMIVPLAMTIYYSFRLYRLISPDRTGWAGFRNYTWFINSPEFWLAITNTLLLVGGVLIITIVLGTLIALLIDQPVWGQGPLRILVISPFFVMPPVAASIWENLFMHPQNGLFSAVSRAFGAQPILFLEQYPMWSVIGIVSWEWLPFATLILLTALQSLSSEELEAAEMDGANVFRRFWYIILPLSMRVILLTTLISVIGSMLAFDQFYIMTGGNPRGQTFTSVYWIYQNSFISFKLGYGAALSILLTLIILVFSTLQVILSNRSHKP